MTRFPMLDPPFQVQSKKQDFMQKSLSNSADLTGRCSPSLHACFIKKMMKKKEKKKMSTH